MYNARQFTMAEIAQTCGVTPMTIYRHISTRQPVPDVARSELVTIKTTT